jgi:hypothetical protein
MPQTATHLAISLPIKERKALQEAAVRYGFRPEALLRQIVSSATQELLLVPEETLDEYENAEEIAQAFRDALKRERKGSLLSFLPKRIASAGLKK